MRDFIHPKADAGAYIAAEDYEYRRRGWGDAFTAGYDRGVASILATPRLHSPADDGPPGVECRDVVRLGRFPYRIVYALIGETIYIIAVPHHKQQPGYWHDRLPVRQPPGAGP